MLSRLDIRDFTLVRALSVEFPGGFLPITGETGAGKSILLGALGLVLGDRANPDLVRRGAKAADVTAEFDISEIPEALAWLTERDLVDEHEQSSCLLRRTLSAEGRSRAFVNGRPVTLQDVKALAEELIDIHSQHAHTSASTRNTDAHARRVRRPSATRTRSCANAHGRWRELADTLGASSRGS